MDCQESRLLKEVRLVGTGKFKKHAFDPATKSCLSSNQANELVQTQIGWTLHIIDCLKCELGLA